MLEMGVKVLLPSNFPLTFTFWWSDFTYKRRVNSQKYSEGVEHRRVSLSTVPEGYAEYTQILLNKVIRT